MPSAIERDCQKASRAEAATFCRRMRLQDLNAITYHDIADMMTSRMATAFCTTSALVQR